MFSYCPNLQFALEEIYDRMFRDKVRGSKDIFEMAKRFEELEKKVVNDLKKIINSVDLSNLSEWGKKRLK